MTLKSIIIHWHIESWDTQVEFSVYIGVLLQPEAFVGCCGFVGEKSVLEH